MKQNSIVNQIFKSLAFDEKEEELIYSKLNKIDLKKGEHLLESGERVVDLYYISDGCLRTYYIDNEGKEHTIQFAVMDWWISDYIALFGNAKSTLNIECIQNATLYKISKIDLDSICDHFPEIERFHRKKMENAFAGFQKRILSNLSQSAKERYLDFIKSYPTIEQQIKNYHIASYLGITTESLSRIRKELILK